MVLVVVGFVFYRANVWTHSPDAHIWSLFVLACYPPLKGLTLYCGKAIGAGPTSTEVALAW